MRGKKLTPREQLERRVKQALNSIRKLEKFYAQDVINSACCRYTLLFRDKRKAIAKKAELEQELEQLKGKI